MDRIIKGADDGKWRDIHDYLRGFNPKYKPYSIFSDNTRKPYFEEFVKFGRG